MPAIPVPTTAIFSCGPPDITLPFLAAPPLETGCEWLWYGLKAGLDHGVGVIQYPARAVLTGMRDIRLVPTVASSVGSLAFSRWPPEVSNKRVARDDKPLAELDFSQLIAAVALHRD